nr:hypothetical protein [Tanacetum cinerariifolium]
LESRLPQRVLSNQSTQKQRRNYAKMEQEQSELGAPTLPPQCPRTPPHPRH